MKKKTSPLAKMGMKNVVVVKGKHDKLDEYIMREDVSSMRNEPIRRGSKIHHFVYNINSCQATAGGLTGYIKRNYIKGYKEPRRRFKKKGYLVDCSSKSLGKRIDREIGLHIKLSCGIKSRSKKPFDPMTIAILQFWERSGLTPVASQLPVVVSEKVCTQVDVILIDEQGKLWMHEIKTGGIQINRVKGTFSYPFDHIDCTKKAQWDLQRHYGHEALVSRGLPLVGSKVIHAYMSLGVAHIHEYPNIF